MRSCPANHLQIVKPTNASDASVGVVIDFIRGSDTPRGRWGTSALALERRDFQKVENQLGPNRAHLDSRALVDLALRAGRVGQASRGDGGPSRCGAARNGRYGVLAGRHKRNWIQGRVESDAGSAIDLYGKAYKTTEDKGDAAQAYYHGINLAFLALVYESARSKARRLADKVLGHCANAEKDELHRDRMWRLATEGERPI